MGALHPPFLGAEAQCLLLFLIALLGQGEGIEFSGSRRMILAQRMPFPGGRKQDASQIRMALEADAEEIPNRPLIPVCRGPEIGDGWKRRGIPGERHLEANILVAREGQELIDDGEIALWLPFPVTAD